MSSQQFGAASDSPGQRPVAETYVVEVASPRLRISAAHFITFAGGECEPLHGHDFLVDAQLTGRLGPGGYVIDFLVVENALAEILRAWDHRTLLPGESSHVSVRVEDGQHVAVSAGDRRWLFPADDVVVVPVANTTSELLAGYLGKALWDALDSSQRNCVEQLRVRFRESGGFAACWTKDVRRLPE